VVDSINEAVFGNVPGRDFDRRGDFLGGITALYYGENVGYIEYDTELDPDGTGEEESEDGLEPKTLVEAIQDGDLSDIQQVLEVALDDVLEYMAVSPVSDGSEILETLREYFPNLSEVA
jgi:hypothetical protein